jgi:O-antigen/teichoic acid export membrane protein
VPLPATARRIGWALGDQAVSSLSNFAVGAVAARALGPVGFGVFGLAYVTYAVLLGLCRGLATDPLMVRMGGGVPREVWRAGARQATGTAVVVGTAAGVLCTAVGLLLPRSIGPAFVALGVVLPGMLLQDSWRFAFFAAGRGSQAFANDVCWTIALVPAVVCVRGSDSAGPFLAAWGGSAAVAAAFGALQAGFLPRPAQCRSWLRNHRELGWRYLAENVCESGSAHLRMVGLGWVDGLGAVGAIRGATQLLGPFIAVMFGMSLVTVAEAARTLRRAPDRLRPFCLLLGGGQALAALAWGVAVLILLPDHVGHSLLGSVWSPARRLLLPMTITCAVSGLNTAATAGLRALGAARLSLRSRLVSAVLVVSIALWSAAAWGVTGFAWGTVAGSALGSAYYWRNLHRGLRAHVSGLPTPTPAVTAHRPAAAVSTLVPAPVGQVKSN